MNPPSHGHVASQDVDLARRSHGVFNPSCPHSDPIYFAMAQTLAIPLGDCSDAAHLLSPISLQCLAHYRR